MALAPYAVPADYVAHEARAADLVITGADRVRRVVDPLWRLDPSELVMKLGRPMMVVPPEVDRLKLSSVVVGWKDTREARRAVVDALPLLQKAKEVTVVEIIENDGDRAAAGRRVADVAAWLGRHQVDACHMVPNLRGDAVEQLITPCQRHRSRHDRRRRLWSHPDARMDLRRGDQGPDHAVHAAAHSYPIENTSHLTTGEALPAVDPGADRPSRFWPGEPSDPAVNYGISLKQAHLNFHCHGRA